MRMYEKSERTTEQPANDPVEAGRAARHELQVGTDAAHAVAEGESDALEQSDQNRCDAVRVPVDHLPEVHSGLQSAEHTSESETPAM